MVGSGQGISAGGDSLVAGRLPLWSTIVQSDVQWSIRRTIAEKQLHNPELSNRKRGFERQSSQGSTNWFRNQPNLCVVLGPVYSYWSLWSLYRLSLFLIAVGSYLPLLPSNSNSAVQQLLHHHGQKEYQNNKHHRSSMPRIVDLCPSLLGAIICYYNQTFCSNIHHPCFTPRTFVQQTFGFSQWVVITCNHYLHDLQVLLGWQALGSHRRWQAKAAKAWPRYQQRVNWRALTVTLTWLDDRNKDDIYQYVFFKKMEASRRSKNNKETNHHHDNDDNDATRCQCHKGTPQHPSTTTGEQKTWSHHIGPGVPFRPFAGEWHVHHVMHLQMLRCRQHGTWYKYLHLQFLQIHLSSLRGKAGKASFPKLTIHYYDHKQGYQTASTRKSRTHQHYDCFW